MPKIQVTVTAVAQAWIRNCKTSTLMLMISDEKKLVDSLMQLGVVTFAELKGASPVQVEEVAAAMLDLLMEEIDIRVPARRSAPVQRPTVT